jgi:hypothetical protein
VAEGVVGNQKIPLRAADAAGLLQPLADGAHVHGVIAFDMEQVAVAELATHFV